MLLNSYKKNVIECGADEAGRGCLADPMTAACVIIYPQFKSEWLKDSKWSNMETENFKKNYRKTSYFLWSSSYL